VTEDGLHAALAAAKSAEAKAVEALEAERKRVRACEEEEASLDAQLGGLDPTAKDFDALALVIVQQRDVKIAKRKSLQERVRDAEGKLADASQGVRDVEAKIQAAKNAKLDRRKDEIEVQIPDVVATALAQLRLLFDELRANRIARNGPNGAWGNGSRWVDVAPADHPDLLRKVLDRWQVFGKPGTARVEDKEAA
jgi:hypothetical protein